MEVLDLWHPSLESVTCSSSHNGVRQFILVFNGLGEEVIMSRFGSTLYLAELQCVSTIGGCNIRRK